MKDFSSYIANIMLFAGMQISISFVCLEILKFENPVNLCTMQSVYNASWPAWHAHAAQNDMS
jgi:hypothetical protein